MNILSDSFLFALEWAFFGIFTGAYLTFLIGAYFLNKEQSGNGHPPQLGPSPKFYTAIFILFVVIWGGIFWW